MHLSETATTETSIDKVHLNCECFHGSFTNGRRECILLSFSLSAQLGFITLRDRTSFLFWELTEDKTGDKIFC